MIVIKDNSKIRKFPNSVPSVDSSNSTQASVIDLNNITNTIYKTGIELEGFFKKQGREDSFVLLPRWLTIWVPLNKRKWMTYYSVAGSRKV